MDFLHENIKTDDTIPVRILLHNVRYVTPHWHNGLELFLVLSGDVNVDVDGEDFQLNEDDLLVINSNEIHSISSKSDNLILALQIHSSFLENVFPNLTQIRIKCCSVQNNGNFSYANIKRMMAEVALLGSKKHENYAIKIYELLYELMYELITYHHEKTVNHSFIKTSKHFDRISSIIQYIKMNYSSNLSLDDVAKSQNLSSNYLSSFFKKHMGMTYLNYLNSLRLESARKDLINTDLFITDIALNNGFPNTKAFNKTFKEMYNVTPNVYRSGRRITNSNGIFNYLQIDDTKVFASLEKYMEPLSVSSEKYYPVTQQQIEINTTAKGKELNHSWKSLITFGRASDGLSSEIQKQLIDMQREIGFKYVRFHGLLDDSMFIYTVSKSGYQFNFNRVFELFDFLLSIQLKPFVEISFMPSELAKEQKSIFVEKSIISMPKNIEIWCDLIKSLLRACILRYGLNEVRMWYFEFWNEPEELGFMWNDSVDDYLAFYKSTYDAIKSVDTDLKFGGPACFAETLINDSWFDTYSTFVKNNHCSPDFFSIHTYPILPNTAPNELSEEKILESILSDNNYQLITISPDTEYLANTLQKVKSVLKTQEFASIPLFITEWNSTIWHRDLCSDTCYKAAYLTKNITENIDKIDGFGFWTISDRIEELFPASTLFHGGLGLITYNGVKKAGYYAYTLLNKLGNRLIESDKGYFITKNEKQFSHNLQILLYNYCHFDNNYRNMDSSYISQSDRYNVFISENEEIHRFSIKGFPNGIVRIKETLISRKSGSAYDTWLDMGCPDMLTTTELETLKMLSVPSIKIEEKTITDSLELSCSLLPHEVVLIEILSL